MIMCLGSGVFAGDESQGGREELVNSLFAERLQLLTGGEDNNGAIAQIDRQLAGLGVETLTADEVMRRISNGSMPRVADPTQRNINWTSDRYQNYYNGKTYEIQIFRATPHDSKNSELKIGYSIGLKKPPTTRAGLLRTAGIVASSIPWYAPKIGNVFSAGQTFYDVMKGYVSDLKPTTVVSSLGGGCVTAMAIEAKYLYVKPVGAADVGNQVLGYSGTNVAARSTITLNSFVTEGGNVVPRQNSFLSDDYAKSFNFDTPSNTACANYISGAYSTNYSVTSMRVDIFEATQTYLNCVNTYNPYDLS